MPVRESVVTLAGIPINSLIGKTLNDSLTNLIDLIIRLGDYDHTQLALNNNF